MVTSNWQSRLNMEDDSNSSLLQRRTTLRDTLKLHSKLSLDPAKDSLQSMGSEDLLLKDLKERRLKRRHQLSPLMNTHVPEIVKTEVQGGKGHEFNAVITPNEQISQRVRHVREQQKFTRFDDLSGGANLSTETRKPELPMRWKTLATHINDVIKKSNDQDSFDFFTSSLDVSPDVMIPSNREQHTLSEDISEQSTGTENDVDVTHEQDIDILTPNDNVIGSLGYPTYISQEERLSKEAQVYFKPSSIPAIKSTERNLPHYIDKEGMYVGKRPKVSWSHMFQMENRILQRKNQDSEWFGEDYLLQVQSDPLRVLNTRPYILLSERRKDILFSHAEFEMSSHNLINQGSGNGVYQLEMDISSLHFAHHPLFSYEHVISSQLQQVYLKYCNKDKKVEDYCTEKVHALKTKIENLKQALKQLNSSSAEAIEIMQYICMCRREIYSIRQRKKNVLASEYALLKEVLRKWKDLKIQREKQGYSSTTPWLTVKKVEGNAVEEEAQLRRDIHDEILEMRDDFLMQSQYLKNGKDCRKLQGTICHQAGCKSPAEEFSSPGLNSSRNSENPGQLLLSTFDESKIQHELHNYYLCHHRPPGEPLLIPELSFINPISQQCPAAEQHRRDEVDKTRFYVKVFFNNQQVSQTKDSTLNQDFSIHFGEIFTVQIVKWPESIKLQIFESKLLTSKLLAEIYVPIPDVQETVKSTSSIEQYLFTSSEELTFTHSAVGSGRELSSLPESGSLLTSGSLNIRVCWGVDSKDRVLCPPEYSPIKNLNLKHTDAVASLGVAGIADLQDVKNWIENSRLDPNDPRNAKLLKLIESIPYSSEQAVYFRLVTVDDAERLISDEEFTSDRRFILLNFRDQGHRGLKNKVVPLSSKAISGSIWKDVLHYKPFADYDLPLLVYEDFYSSRKEEQNKFLLDIRERVLSRIHSVKNDVALSEVVISDFIPNISALKLSIVELLVPRRPLRPVRREREKIKAQNANITSATITIRVIRAFNIPVRRKIQETSTTPLPTRTPPQISFPLPYEDVLTDENRNAKNKSGDPITLEMDKIVSPYVEVSYERTIMRTTTACGPNPFWNEELIIPFQPPGNDFSPSNLHTITNVIHINVFDEVVVDVLEDGRERATNIHNRIEKRWLGNFTIPFSTLLLRQSVEGTFQLEIPVILLGYEKDGSSCKNPLLGNNTSQLTYLQLFITMDPPLGTLAPHKDQFLSDEEGFMLEHASEWLRSIREKFPNRYYTGTALDVSGKHVFVTRFIKPQKPPSEFSSLYNNNLHLMEHLAHYVSLIPFLSDALIFSGICNIWSTSDQFLRMMAGDEEEHAILLCNYFLFTGIKAWIILGHAVPEGETAYVLSENPQAGGVGYWIWNPCTGSHYGQYEPHCPLISVGCIIDNTNVWANIQEYEDPSRMQFTLSDHKKWCPLSVGIEPLSSIQQNLNYSETNDARVMELQERIECSLREHIMALRSRFITRWNRHCTRILQRILPLLEEHLSTPPDFSGELAEISASYEMTGFPIQVRYSNIEQLLLSVERTGIHLSENKKVEYSLAVYVHSYPNDVLSVWLYIVSMIPK